MSMRKCFFGLSLCIYLFAHAQQVNPQLLQTKNPAPSSTASNTPITLDQIANPQSLTLSSSNFQSQQKIPITLACTQAQGLNQIPHLNWTNPPIGTLAYLITLTDPDAQPTASNIPFTHWILYNIPGNATSVDSSTAKLYATGKNSYGRLGYDGPCPASGTHHYVFTLYALNHYFPTTKPLVSKDIEYIIQHQPNVILEQATLMGTFSS